jgi:hypothetical protein
MYSVTYRLLHAELAVADVSDQLAGHGWQPHSVGREARIVQALMTPWPCTNDHGQSRSPSTSRMEEGNESNLG